MAVTHWSENSKLDHNNHYLVIADYDPMTGAYLVFNPAANQAFRTKWYTDIETFIADGYDDFWVVK